MFEIYSVIDVRTNQAVYTNRHKNLCEDFITDQCNENHESSQYLKIINLLKTEQTVES